MNSVAFRSNVQSSPGRGVKGETIAYSRRARGTDGRGFTLVELLVVVTIIPLIIGALAGGLLEVFSLQSGVANRLGDAADAQVIAATFVKDVQSASSITTNPSTSTQCGAGTQLLELEWGNGSVVSYVEKLQSGTTYSLVRNYCASGPSGTPTTSNALSYDVLPPCPVADSIATCTSLKLQPPPVAYDGSTVVDTTAATPVTTVGMTSLQFPIVEPKSSYTYQLSATPAGGASTAITNLGLPSTGYSCGFALPGTGTFSNTMCFVGFTTSQLQQAESGTCAQTNPGHQGQDTSVNVPGGYIMTFCLSLPSSDNLSAVTTPVGGGTCRKQGTNGCDVGSISNGQGFLGNLDTVSGGGSVPFYAGIGCPVSTPILQNGTVTSSCIQPAIFQTTNGGTDTVTLSNIQVFSPQGTSATGYEVITADAETVDPANGAYLKWTSTSPASKPLPFNLVPNFTSSDLGNACNEVPTTGYNGQPGYLIENGDTTIQIGGTNYTGGLTGLGTATVECQSNWQTSYPWLRTGTAMIGITPPTVGGSAQPVTISVQLKGEGFNAVAFGLLLP